MKDIEPLEKNLKVIFRNKELLQTALVHRSYINEHKNFPSPHNERLEFLGDAVLELVVTEHLYRNYPNPEGELTNYRAAIVCTGSLAEEAKRLGYGEFLLLSNGEETSGGRNREYILANTFEAVLGALFLEKGLDTCRDFVKRELLYKVESIIENEKYKDAKSKFQEAAQDKQGITPTYEVLESWGLDHEKTFKVGVYLGKDLFGIGEGKSKQKAEQQAAFVALDKLEKL